MYDGHGGKNRRRHSRNRAIRWIAFMAAESHRKRDWRDMAEDDGKDTAATLPLVIHSIRGRISLADTGAAYVTLLLSIVSFICGTSIAAYQSIDTTNAYRHAKTCALAPPAPPDPACITVVGLSLDGWTSGTAVLPGSELTLSGAVGNYGSVRFPHMASAITDYPVPITEFGIQVQGDGDGDGDILHMTESGVSGAVWQGKVVWVADANGVRYQSTDVPGAVPVGAITALGALSALFLLVLHLRRKYVSRRSTQRGLGPVVALIALAAMTFGITELALGAGWAAWVTAGTPPLVYAASAGMSWPARPAVRRTGRR